MGMGAQVDKAVLSINRGAEDAVAYAKPIFLDAIKEMTLTDALNIVKGNKDAATQYFKQKTSPRFIHTRTHRVCNLQLPFDRTLDMAWHHHGITRISIPRILKRSPLLNL